MRSLSSIQAKEEGGSMKRRDLITYLDEYVELFAVLASVQSLLIVP